MVCLSDVSRRLGDSSDALWLRCDVLLRSVFLHACMLAFLQRGLVGEISVPSPRRGGCLVPCRVHGRQRLRHVGQGLCVCVPVSVSVSVREQVFAGSSCCYVHRFFSVSSTRVFQFRSNRPEPMDVEQFMGDVCIAGFRIHAAKHIDVGELGSLLSRMTSNVCRFQEVISGENEAVSPDMCYSNCDVTEFNFVLGSISILIVVEKAWFFLCSPGRFGQAEHAPWRRRRDLQEGHRFWPDREVRCPDPYCLLCML